MGMPYRVNPRFRMVAVAEYRRVDNFVLESEVDGDSAIRAREGMHSVEGESLANQ